MIKIILLIMFFLAVLFLVVIFTIMETLRKKMLEQKFFTEQEMYQILADPKYKDDVVSSVIKYYLVIKRLFKWRKI